MDISSITVSIDADIKGFVKKIDLVTQAAQSIIKANPAVVLKETLVHYNDSLGKTEKSMKDMVNNQGKITNPVKFAGLIDQYTILQQAIKKTEKAINKLGEAQKNMKAIGTQMTSSLQNGLAAVGQSIGQMAAGKSNPFAALYKVLQSSVEALGKQLIKIGIPLLAVPGMQAEGLLYEAGGIALEAVGSAMSAIKMASGGLVSGSAFVNVGEYAGAAHNPEVIAPLDKLRGMLGGEKQVHEFRISGDSLVSVLSRNDTNNQFALGDA